MMHVIMPTAGRGGLLQRALESLARCEQADAATVIVVENGPAGDARRVCDTAPQDLNVRYLHCEIPGKNRALNLGLAELHDDDLAILCDDDIRFSTTFLNAYVDAAKVHRQGHFFGGPFDVDYETQPPAWLIRYLPLSAKGWAPSPDDIRPDRTWFLGFNWAARALDLRQVGGFDEAIGPGSSSNSTGDEVVMQKRMHAVGLKATLVPDAKVWHHVPSSRCSPDWALDRAYRDGLARGQYVRQKRGLRLVGGHVTQAIRLAQARSQQFTGLRQRTERERFATQYKAQKSAGYYAAFKAA